MKMFKKMICLVLVLAMAGIPALSLAFTSAYRNAVYSRMSAEEKAHITWLHVVRDNTTGEEKKAVESQIWAFFYHVGQKYGITEELIAKQKEQETAEEAAEETEEAEEAEEAEEPSKRNGTIICKMKMKKLTTVYSKPSKDSKVVCKYRTGYEVNFIRVEYNKEEKVYYDYIGNAKTGKGIGYVLDGSLK